MTCNKCKQSPRFHGDTWCLPCSAWQQLGCELAETWATPGSRLLCGDLIISTLRQVRALRRLAGAGAGSSPAPPAGEVSSAAASGSQRPAEPAGPPPGLKAAAKAGAASSRPEERKEKEDGDSYSGSEEATSPQVRGGREPLARARRSRAKSEEARRSPERRERSRRREKRKSDREGDRHGKRRRREGHRGGRNHPRLYRAEQDPFKPLHQRRPGQVLEFNLRASTVMCFEDVWAAMLIEERSLGSDGNYILRGALLGVEEHVGRDGIMDSLRKVGLTVHLCKEELCQVEGDIDVHCTRIRVWDPEGFLADYTTPDGAAVLNEVNAARAKERKAKAKKDDAKAPPTRSRNPTKAAPKEPPPKAGVAKQKATAKKKGKAPEETGGGGGADRELLRARLDELRRRVKGRGEAAKSGVDTEAIGSALDEFELVTGMSLNPTKPSLAIEDQPEEQRKGTTKRLRTRKTSTPGSAQALLLAKAEQQEAKRKEERRKQGTKKSKEEKLARVLVAALTGKGGKKRKKKRKKRKRKREDEGDGPEGGDGGSSGGGSDSSGSKDGSPSDCPSDGEGTHSRSPSEESRSYEAPLRKKSQTRPGSVMELLVKQAAYHLDQAAILEGEGGGSAVTGGVRIASYFSLMVRPYHQPTHPMVRELYSLAQIIDCLRGGRLGQAADGLAARFIAVHQALEDGNWSSASALELFALEPTSSAPTSTLLRAQRYKKLVAKAQGWVSPYKGKGSNYKGNAQWGNYGDYTRGDSNKGKSKKGKGGKGKGQQKGKYGGGDQKHNPWNDSKDDKKTPEGGCGARKKALSGWAYVKRIGHAVRRGLARHGRALFPFTLGPLARLAAVYRGTPLEAVMSEEFLRREAEDSWVFCLVTMANGLNGPTAPMEEGKWSALQKRGAEEMRTTARRMLSLDDNHPRSLLVIEKELSDRFLTYTGDEVPKLLPMSADQIEKALPPTGHGGSIDILELVGGRTRSFLRFPDLCLLSDDGQVLPKLQAKVHFQEGEKLKVAKLLVDRRVCDWIPLSEVIRYRGEPVLNGMFAVGKDSFLDDGRQVQRCIMNLIPSNSILAKLEGSVGKLPHITQWLSITMEGHEELRFFQSDMSCAFYLFALPDAWRKMLAFNILVPGDLIDRDPSITFALSCRVLPMGWASAVGVMQEVAESLAKLGNLSDDQRLIKSRAVPMWLVTTIQEGVATNRAWYHVYLDNFCAAEKVVNGSNGAEGQHLHESIEKSWRDTGVISSAKKRISGEGHVFELGAYAGGTSRILGGSVERLVKLLQTTLFVIGQPRLKIKWVQMVAGRWIHILQFRRAGMSLLNEVWQFTSQTKKGPTVETAVRRELLRCCMGCLTFHTHLGAIISQVTTASDASKSGGAVGVARELTTLGSSFVQWDRSQTSGGNTIPVMVLSLFNGIGGAFRCYDIAGFSPEVLVSFDTHGPANRIVSRRWPHAIIHTDVRQCNREMMIKWLFAFPQLQAIHVWAGFPCTDLSRVKAFRKNLRGQQSGLFGEVTRILKELKIVFGFTFDIRFTVENVSSMDVEAEQEISHTLGRKPFLLNCLDSVPVQRPRFCWTNIDCEVEIEGAWKEDEGRYVRIYLPAEYPRDSQWLSPGAWRTPGTVFPTCMKAIPRQQPPPQPAGLSRCDRDTILRWQADNMRYPPYQYREEFIIWAGNRWRLLNSEEREILHGYGSQHTSLCYSASMIKQRGVAYEDERCSLVGDSFSILSFVYFAAQSCRRFGEPLSYPRMVQRMGLAPGFSCHKDAVAPLSRDLQYGVSNCPKSSVEMLHRCLLRRVNHTGSDIRISSGLILNPKAFPRQSVCSEWWSWKPLFAYQWKRNDHINPLELRSIIHAIQWRISHLREQDVRVFHITDSYVCMSIIGKGRSSSRMLNRLLQQLNAWLLVFNVQLLVLHVESTDNPTDEQSRLGSSAHHR
eukprot:Skav205025  [mRNA]  locus=scaffold1026:370533:376645:- [translate_table: standard]